MPQADVFLQKVANEFFSPLYELAIGITIVYFLYGVMRYVYDLATSKTEGQDNGRRHLFWGMVGLFIVLSIGGIMKIIGSMFDGFFK